MNIKIIVAAHKKCRMPNNEIYLPLQAGAELSSDFGIAKDNNGINISDKHDLFAELTCLYWAWKNVHADYIGLVHYRRYFCGSGVPEFSHIANRDELEKILSHRPIIVPKKRHYYVETVYSQFAHAHDIRNLDMAGKIIYEKYPSYMSAFENIKKRRSSHICNMFIMRQDYLDEYCQWLFSILFELESRISIKQETRSFGFVGERLLDIWLETNHIDYAERDMWTNGVENKFIKGIKMLGRKIKNSGEHL